MIDYTIWSYLSTAHKHKVSAYTAICEAYLGNAMKTIFPDEKKVRKSEGETSNDTTMNNKEAGVAGVA